MNTCYHRSCFKDFTRTDLQNASPDNAVSDKILEDFVSNFIECNVIRLNSYVEIKTITYEYMRSVKNCVEKTIKKRVKSYLLNRSDIFILRPLLANQSEVVGSQKSIETAFFTYNDSKSTNENDQLVEAFKQTRDMLLAEPEWQFNGVFDNFKIDDRILSLFKILIGGKNPHSSKTDFINSAAMLLAQYTEDLILSERQVGHKDYYCYSSILHSFV